jgi:heme-degrading monooxygenase HmoA
MIARIWHGMTKATDAERYTKFLKERAVPDYAGVKGNKGVHILRRIDGDAAHFLTLTYWESRDAIRAFAGDDIAKAKYYPEDKDFLLEFEPTVAHYKVVGAKKAVSNKR